MTRCRSVPQHTISLNQIFDQLTLIDPMRMDLDPLASRQAIMRSPAILLKSEYVQFLYSTTTSIERTRR
jgi:hypothetical protein